MFIALKVYFCIYSSLVIEMVQLRYVHFATYALLYTLYGCVVTAVGPIILYFSQVTGHDETYFSFIFLARAGGYLVGGSLIKLLTRFFSYHQLMVSLVVIFGGVLIASSFSFGFMNLTISMLLIGTCCCMLNVLSNLCIFVLFTGDDQDYWIQFINLFFGIGGLIGPGFVIYYHQYAMRAIGIVVFVCLVPFFFLQSPEGKSQTKQVEHLQQSGAKKEKKLQLPRQAQFCLCLLLFFYIAQQVGYAGWIPTYAFKAGVADERAASALASIFWITNTIARLILMYLRGTVAGRLSVLLKLLVGSTLIVLIIQWTGQLGVVSYLGVISSGIFLSAMYALFFSLSQQYGYQLTTSTTANLAMSASLGQGLLVMPIGYAMGLLGYQALIYIIFLLSMVMWLIFKYVNTLMENDSRQKKEVNMTPLVAMGQF